MERFDAFIRRNGLDKKSYQYDGVQFCLFNELSLAAPCQVRGGFLADEMGLGKTITMLGLMETNPLPLTLVVLPVILMDQWVTAIQKWMPKCRCLVYYGNTKKKITCSDMIVGKYDVVITTYMTVVGEFMMKKKEGKVEGECEGDREGVLFQISWNRVVFDEAHHLRNSRTSRWRACYHLPSQIRWLVSGTPVQNSKHDFYGLCGMLKLPASYYKDKDQLMDLARNFILRRKKADVLGEGIGGGGEKLIQTVMNVSWKNKAEKDLALAIHSVLSFNVGLGREEREEREESEEREEREEGVGVGSGICKILSPVLEKSSPLVCMLRAKQMCSLPCLLTPFLKPLADSDSLSETELDAYRESIHASSKMDQVVSTLVERKDNGKGKLVFCQFSGEIDHLVSRLASYGISVAVLDGRTRPSMRKKNLGFPLFCFDFADSNGL